MTLYAELVEIYSGSIQTADLNLSIQMYREESIEVSKECLFAVIYGELYKTDICLLILIYAHGNGDKINVNTSYYYLY